MRGRPRAAKTAILIRAVLTLREGEDDDLLEAFRRVPPRKRAAFIKASMRSGGLQVDLDALPDDEELLDSLDQFLA
ncbi:MAG: hypothetical protein ACOYYI_01640 [Chloroflexota bacterium]